MSVLEGPILLLRLYPPPSHPLISKIFGSGEFYWADNVLFGFLSLLSVRLCPIAQFPANIGLRDLISAIITVGRHHQINVFGISGNFR